MRQLIFDDDDGSGAFGDVILVNGVPWPNMQVEPRQYRFRMLDVAASRSFELSLSVKGSSTKLPLTVVATDGGIMEIARATTSLRVGMAERYEVVIDFAGLAGRTLLLRNQSPENNIDFATTGTVMQFQVGATVSDTANNATVPGKRLLPKPPPAMALTATPTTPRRSLEFKRENGEWTVNGKTWNDVIASGFTAALASPKLDAVEVWTLANPRGGWFHPVHIHLINFQILSRTGGRNKVFDYERGPKDVVYLGENETATVIARFGPQPGRYMLHCHNLVHEDHDMMHQFWVRPPDGFDPMGTRAGEPARGRLAEPAAGRRRPAVPAADRHERRCASTVATWRWSSRRCCRCGRRSATCWSCRTHFREWWAYGLFFLGAASAQAAFGGARAAPARAVAAAGGHRRQPRDRRHVRPQQDQRAAARARTPGVRRRPARSTSPARPPSSG